MSYTKEVMSAEVRELIDRAIAEGLEMEEVRQVLSYHYDGTPYYYQDAERYGADLNGNN